MDAINRSAVIVMAAQPFSGLVPSGGPNQCRVEPGGSETRATIYLLPEYATEEEARAYLKEFCSEIFEEQLDKRTDAFRSRLIHEIVASLRSKRRY